MLGENQPGCATGQHAGQGRVEERRVLVGVQDGRRLLPERAGQPPSDAEIPAGPATQAVYVHALCPQPLAERADRVEAIDRRGDPAGQPNSLRINPTQQTGGFATRWSYGWRGLMRLVYNHALGDANLSPALIWFHDLGGISPASTPNYLSGRVVLFSSVDLELSRALRLTLQHQLYDGAGRRNLLSDRDNLALSLSYSF